MCIFVYECMQQKEKRGSEAYLGGLMQPGSLQRLILSFCVGTRCHCVHFILLLLLSSTDVKMPQEKRLRLSHKITSEYYSFILFLLFLCSSLEPHVQGLLKLAICILY